MSIPPPPPYSLHPPPTYTRQRDKSRSSYSRPTSREMLTEALQHAQLAVKLDMAGSDMSAIITAYDETIALLERVIARRTHKPGTKADVERVTDIYDRYSDRVRELCMTHHIPLPHHVPPAEAETPRPTPLPHPPITGESSPIPPPLLPHSHLRAQFRPDSQLTIGDEMEWVTKSSSLPSRFSSTSSSTTSSSSSPSTPIFQDTSRVGDDSHDCLTWMVTEACDAELEEWGQYLGEGEDMQVSVATVTPSAEWNDMVSVAHAESVSTISRNVSFCRS